jgi:hypothetical protein
MMKLNIAAHDKGRRKMTAATGEGQWTTTVMTTMRGNSREMKVLDSGFCHLANTRVLAK